MNQKAAFAATVLLAQDRGMPMLATPNELGLAHMLDMWDRINSNEYSFSPSKMGRWLGWAQAALVAANVGVYLEDVKQINMRYANEVGEDGS